MEYTPSNALAISEHLERLALQEEIRNYPCTHNEMSWQVEMMKHSTVLWEFHKVYDLPIETMKQKEAMQNGFQSLNWASAHSEFLK